MLKNRYTDNLFIERFGEHPLRNFALLVILFWGIFNVIFVQIQPLSPTPPKTFTSLDYTRILSWICLYILLGWGTVYIRRSYTRTIQDLHLNEKHGMKEELKTHLIDKRIWWFCFLALGIHWIFYHLPGKPFYIWFAGTRTYRKEGLIWPIVSFIGWMIIWDPLLADFAAEIVNLVFFFPRKIKDNIEIKPLSPDECGGVSPLGRLSLSLTIIYFASVTLSSMAGGLTHYFKTGKLFDLSFTVISIGYAIFGVIVFLVPQLFIHTTLKEKKQQVLDQLAEIVERKREQGDWEKMRGLIETLRQTKRMRTLPYETATLKKLAGAIVTSLLLPRLLPLIFSLF